MSGWVAAAVGLRAGQRRSPRLRCLWLSLSLSLSHSLSFVRSFLRCSTSSSVAIVVVVVRHCHRRRRRRRCCHQCSFVPSFLPSQFLVVVRSFVRSFGRSKIFVVVEERRRGVWNSRRPLRASCWQMDGWWKEGMRSGVRSRRQLQDTAHVAQWLFAIVCALIDHRCAKGHCRGAAGDVGSDNVGLSGEARPCSRRACHGNCAIVQEQIPIDIW